MRKTTQTQLKNYLITAKDWVSCEELASYLHISNRSVRNHVKAINGDKKPSNIISSTRGYRWNQSSEHTDYYFTVGGSFPETPDERELFILRHVLYYHKLQAPSVQDYLAISDRTFEADLIRIRSRLRLYDLKLHNVGQTLFLSGREWNLRRMIYHCVLSSNSVKLLSLDYLTQGFPTVDVHGMFNRLSDTMQRYGLESDGFSLYHFLLHVIIQYLQLKHSMFVESLAALPSTFENTPDFHAACAFAAYQADFVHFPRQELHYLAILFLSYCSPLQPQTAQPLTDSDGWIKLNNFSRRLLDIPHQYLQINCSDELMVCRLSSLIERMQVRQRFQFDINYPVTDALRQVHPLLFDISANMMIQISQEYSVYRPEQEICSLAILLGNYLFGRMPFESKVSCKLICPLSASFAEKLSSDIQERLGRILDLVAIISTTDISDQPETDITLTVIPAPHIPHAVNISILPKSEDYRAIRHEIQVIKSQKCIRQLHNYLYCYQYIRIFECHCSFRDKSHALNRLCRKLAEIEAVDDTFHQELLQREKMDSTVFCNTVALPHLCSTSVLQNTIYIAICDEPVSWNESKTNMIILSAIQKKYFSDYVQIYSLLTSLFSDTKNAKILQKASDFDSFMERINKLIF